MVFSVGLFWHSLKDISHISAHVSLMKMKLVAMIVIFFCSAYQDNSNYLSLLIALHIYLLGVWVDVITLLNYFGLLVFYDVFQQKLKDILKSSANPDYMGLQKVKQLGLEAK